jgi:putative dimethyl sulfoxide reductase chaperone
VAGGGGGAVGGGGGGGGGEGGGGGGGGGAGSCLDEPPPRLADVCARRAAVYQALALGFCEPTAAYLSALAGGELVEGLREAVAWLGSDAELYEPALAALAAAGSAAALTDPDTALAALAVEHARLFTGPGHPAVRCYATQYLEPGDDRPARLNGAAAAYAAAAYAAAGVTAADARPELPDHVAVELEFLFHLCRSEETAWERDASDDALQLRRSLDAFLREHAARFFGEFAAEVRAAAPAPLYGALADLLDAHVVAELGGPAAAEERAAR